MTDIFDSSDYLRFDVSAFDDTVIPIITLPSNGLLLDPDERDLNKIRPLVQTLVFWARNRYCGKVSCFGEPLADAEIITKVCLMPAKYIIAIWQKICSNLLYHQKTYALCCMYMQRHQPHEVAFVNAKEEKSLHNFFIQRDLYMIYQLIVNS